MPSAQHCIVKKDQSPLPLNASGKALSWSMLVCLVASIGALLVPIWFIADSALPPKGLESEIPAHIKRLKSSDLRTMLSSTNVMARAYAVQELYERRDLSADTQLIRLLTDFSKVQFTGGSKQTTVAELASNALVQILRLKIWQQPDNIGLLIPYFRAATTGSLNERKAIIGIMGELREPMAKQLLLRMISDPDPVIRNAAADALANFDFGPPQFLPYVARWRIELIFAAGLVILIGCLLLTTVKLLLDRTHFRICLLSLIPLVLLGWITCFALFDFSMGIANERAIVSAIRHRDALALKIKHFHHVRLYAGDSYLNQFLVKMGTAEAVRTLLLLPNTAPDNHPAYVKHMRDQARWVISRIIGTRLGTSELNDMEASNSQEVRATIADYLGRLGVKNQAIIDTLSHLTNDRNAEVRKKAAEALVKARRSPDL